MNILSSLAFYLKANHSASGEQFQTLLTFGFLYFLTVFTTSALPSSSQAKKKKLLVASLPTMLYMVISLMSHNFALNLKADMPGQRQTISAWEHRWGGSIITDRIGHTHINTHLSVALHELGHVCEVVLHLYMFCVCHSFLEWRGGGWLGSSVSAWVRLSVGITQPCSVAVCEDH